MSSFSLYYTIPHEPPLSYDLFYEYSMMPDDLVLLLFNYLEYTSKVALVSCCRSWFYNWMKRYVRELQFERVSYKEAVEMKPARLVAEPFEQISIKILERKSSTYLYKLIHDFSFKLHSIAFLDPHFPNFSFMDNVSLRVKHFTVTCTRRVLGDIGFEISAKLLDCMKCESFSFHYLGDELILIPIPFSYSLKQLSLERIVFHRSMEGSILNYIQTLQHLTLFACNISDVSLLGSIPILELIECNSISDLSPLNNNDQMVINHCVNVRDFSRSFAYSRKIHLVFSYSESDSFDLNHWKRIEDLSLSGYYVRIMFAHSNNHLPVTVKKCSLEGGFVADIDFTMTGNHQLLELSLSGDDTIESLEHYRLEEVRIVKLVHMKGLKSLQGLGKNQSVSVSYCHAIRDFSPLQHIPIVEIKYCEGFMNPFAVKSVHTLTIIPVVGINFASFESISATPFQFIQSLTLTLLKTPDCVQDFDGLENIPYLQMNFQGYKLIKEFVRRGNVVHNRKIVLFRRDEDDKVPADIVDFHSQTPLLKDYYDYDDTLPKKWVWFRKSFKS